MSGQSSTTFPANTCAVLIFKMIKAQNDVNQHLNPTSTTTLPSPSQTKELKLYTNSSKPLASLSLCLFARSSPASRFGRRWRHGPLSGLRSPGARMTSCARTLAARTAPRSGASRGPSGWSAYTSSRRPAPEEPARSQHQRGANTSPAEEEETGQPYCSGPSLSQPHARCVFIV